MTRVDGFHLVAKRWVSTATDSPGLREEVESDLAAEASGRAQESLASLLSSTSIWFPVELYGSMPVVLPHVLRDNDCRKQLCASGHRKKTKGNIGELRDLWSTPSSEGYVRDDNSLVKMLAKGLKISSPHTDLDGATMGHNWVACHIWPMADATDPWLNSFVPNLVWLPKPLDVMSDLDGHLVQKVLRRTSLNHFASNVSLAPQLTTELFESLQHNFEDTVEFEIQNTFNADIRWINRRWKKIEDLSQILGAVAAGVQVSCSSGHSHFDGHITDLVAGEVAPLADRLSHYLRLVRGE